MFGPRPPAPGHGAADEFLGFMAPSAGAETSVLTVTGTSALIAPARGRKTIILQPYQDIWLNVGAAAVPNQCMLIPAMAIFGVDLYSNVEVYAMSTAASSTIFVMQLVQLIQ